MTGTGPFLWLAKAGSPHGYHALPEGGLCLSAFLFVERDGKLLLGKYRPHDEWPRLTGLDASRQAAHSGGWTIPASHLKFGEDPRAAARRVAFDVLGLPEDAVAFEEPTVETDVGEPARFPGIHHYDVWFFVDATLTRDVDPAAPPWYAELAWVDPRATPASAFARSHEEIVARWQDPASRPVPGAVTPGA